MKPYFETKLGKLYHGEASKILYRMPDFSVQCCITSPPYWALRDYGVDEQLGIESTPHEYIKRLCDIFDEVKRVLEKDGTCFVVIGDSYAGAGGMGSRVDNKTKKGMQRLKDYSRNNAEGIKNKSLCQIPSRFAIEAVSRGWVLRNEIIWHKPNCMPSSARDRFTVDFEKIFFFSKNDKYKFNQQVESYTKPLDRWSGNNLKADGQSVWDEGTGQSTYRNRNMRPNPDGRNKRCVWQVPTKPNSFDHFAVYPEALIEPCLFSGTDKNNIILDCFAGSGTSLLAAMKHNRRFVGIEISEEYCEIAAKRIEAEASQLKLFA